MEENKSNSSTAGIGFTGLLTLAFIILKLMHFIDWSWWWVLAPIWIVTLIYVAIFAVGLTLMALGMSARKRRARR